jgi:hypothetical protein
MTRVSQAVARGKNEALDRFPPVCGLVVEPRVRAGQALACHRRLSPEEKAHHAEVRAAKKGLRRATKEYEKTIRRVDKQVADASDPPKLSSIRHTGGWATLYEDRIETSGGTRHLTPELQAAVDTAGNLAMGGRSTLTRMGAGAVIAGPLGLMVGAAAKKDKKVDTRELYLLLQDSEWGAVIPCDPDKGQAVRQLALDIQAAAGRAPQAAAERKRLIERLKRDLHEARRDTSSVTAADAKLNANRGTEDAGAPSRAARRKPRLEGS